MPLFLVFVWVAIASLPSSEIPLGKRPTVTESISEGDLSSPTFQIVPHGKRLRYRLDGLDPDWTEDRDEMNLVARFVNQSGDDIERVAFSVTRKNLGWDHKDPDHRFALRREVITTPPDATAVQIIITSSGSPQAIGTYTVKDLSITASDQGGSRILMKNGMKPEWNQPGWNRSGTRPSMALENPDLPGELSLVTTVSRITSNPSIRASPGLSGTPSGFQFATVVHFRSPPPLSNPEAPVERSWRSNAKPLRTKPWASVSEAEEIEKFPVTPWLETSKTPLAPEKL